MFGVSCQFVYRAHSYLNSTIIVVIKFIGTPALTVCAPLDPNLTRAYEHELILCI